MSIFRTQEEHSLRSIRESFGWNQDELAHKIGVSLSTLSRWERGLTSPPILAPMTRLPNRAVSYLRAMTPVDLVSGVERSPKYMILLHSASLRAFAVSTGLRSDYPLVGAALGLPIAPFFRSETKRVYSENVENFKIAVDMPGSSAEWFAPGDGTGLISDGLVLGIEFLGHGLLSVLARRMNEAELSRPQIGRLEFSF